MAMAAASFLAVASTLLFSHQVIDVISRALPVLFIRALTRAELLLFFRMNQLIK